MCVYYDEIYVYQQGQNRSNNGDNQHEYIHLGLTLFIIILQANIIRESMSVLVETSFGDFTIDLETQKCPNASYNFLKLCKLKHYNNSLFSKVQKDYVTQVTTERPTTIWKELNESTESTFKDQLDMQARVNAQGLIITSNSGPNLNNSQFFITLTKAHLSSLNGKHSIFGRIQEGFETLKKINETYVDAKNRPQMNIRILHTYILDDPFDDPVALKQLPSPQLKRDSDRLEAVEHLEMLQKYESQKDILQATRKQKAKKQAITLQMLGDLPDANMKPPQNILFICKLNPITQERDLQIIFSRFGPIKSVEVVRDWKTGQSLQYGFIQFESEKSCEEAYLKMENVLIDDRRIHVDFSQSVSKVMPRMKNNQNRHRNVNDNRQKNKQLIANVRDQRTYHGNNQYDIIAKESYRNKKLQIDEYERQKRKDNYKKDESSSDSADESSQSISSKQQRKKSHKKIKKQRKRSREKQLKKKHRKQSKRSRQKQIKNKHKSSHKHKKRRYSNQ